MQRREVRLTGVKPVALLLALSIGGSAIADDSRLPSTILLLAGGGAAAMGAAMWLGGFEAHESTVERAGEVALGVGLGVLMLGLLFAGPARPRPKWKPAWRATSSAWR